jgi:hypothetical protein
MRCFCWSFVADYYWIGSEDLFVVDRMLRRDRRGGPVLRVRRGGAGEHRGGCWRADR